MGPKKRIIPSFCPKNLQAICEDNYSRDSYKVIGLVVFHVFFKPKTYTSNEMFS